MAEDDKQENKPKKAKWPISERAADLEKSQGFSRTQATNMYETKRTKKKQRKN